MAESVNRSYSVNSAGWRNNVGESAAERKWRGCFNGVIVKAEKYHQIISTRAAPLAKSAAMASININRRGWPAYLAAA